jgi:maleate isomerase
MTDNRERRILGMLTPSSNTALEPITTEMLRQLKDTSAHFNRLRVTEISLAEKGIRQFDLDAFLTAAELLSDAKCNVIAWNGTSAAWLGFANDEELCRRIGEECGAAATTSILANNDLFRRHGIERFALVTPYTSDVQEKIIENFAAAGFQCVAERHLGIRDNFSFSEVPPETIEQMCRDVAVEKPQAISIICTNLHSARLAPGLEAELGIPVYDSISVVVLRAVELAGGDASQIQGWGRIFNA